MGGSWPESGSNAFCVFLFFLVLLVMVLDWNGVWYTCVVNEEGKRAQYGKMGSSALLCMH